MSGSNLILKRARSKIIFTRPPILNSIDILTFLTVDRVIRGSAESQCSVSDVEQRELLPVIVTHHLWHWNHLHLQIQLWVRNQFYIADLQFLLLFAYVKSLLMPFTFITIFDGSTLNSKKGFPWTSIKFCDSEVLSMFLRKYWLKTYH